MNYRIEENHEYNSREVYFDEKPVDTVRLAMKRLKMRWHGQKKCWYGYASEHEIIAAICDNTPDDSAAQTAVITDGYMGGGAVYGAKSNRHLYGQELKRAIMDDIKAAGIKGVTLSCKTYTGGQHITATITTTPADLASLEAFIDNYRVIAGKTWLYYIGEDGEMVEITTDKYYDLPDAEQERIRQAAAKFEYHKEALSRCGINQHCIDRYNVFSPRGIAKIKAVNAIIAAYRYDDSNSMVDYFDTNFYYDIVTRPGQR
jgi:hypothetical protein